MDLREGKVVALSRGSGCFDLLILQLKCGEEMLPLLLLIFVGRH